MENEIFLKNQKRKKGKGFFWPKSKKEKRKGFLLAKIKKGKKERFFSKTRKGKEKCGLELFPT